MTAPPLWSSSSGRIACRRHLPEPGTPGWWEQRWERASAAWLEGWTQSRDKPAACEACVALEELARLDEESS